MKKVIVYDCDGVLFNSLNAVKAYYDHVFDKFGIPGIDWEDNSLLSLAMMGTNEEIVKYFVKDKALVDEMLIFATKMNFKEFTPLMIPNPHIHQTLEKLSSSGYRLSVFTNRGISLSYLLTYFNMGNFFSYNVTCMDVAKPKPDPEGLYKIMEFYSTKREELLFVGDSMTDYLAAKTAEVDFLAYEKQLSESRVISCHTEIFNYLPASTLSFS